MKLITMDGAYDCGAAVLAMALGLKSAQSAYPMLGYDPNEGDGMGVGVCEPEVLAILDTCQMSYRVSTSLECLVFMQKVSKNYKDTVARRSKLFTSKQLGSMLMQRKGGAIVSVPDVCKQVYSPDHYVFVHNGQVYDPSRGVARYIGDAYSLPICSVIFIERQKSKFEHSQNTGATVKADSTHGVDYLGVH